MKRSGPPARKAWGHRGKGLSRAARRREEPGRAEAAAAFKVAVTGSLDSRMESHHAVPKQTLARIAGSLGLEGPAFWAVVYDPRVGIALDPRVHEMHTTRVRVIPGDQLPERVFVAAAEYGPEAEIALEREHPLGGRSWI